MYIHLGRDYVLNDRDIIGIFDLDITSQSGITRHFLDGAEREGVVITNSR
jgi:hypothetical protein